ncbi:probable G-protein coupled receptor 139 isoform X1 [Hydra vulgaris]|uniref:probable G-protein coupled receptor 139 isoform X1 n=1 Tax=Hydra vulgaris TaxID=6087 RepID=UPI0002B42518|nr:probable G-protein coupled receptor 139 isoform X1 [Hydra vulgaris]
MCNGCLLTNSFKSAERLHWILSVPFGIIISILGLLGNALSIIIWKRLVNTKLRNNQSTGIFLIALAVCDSGLLIFFVLQDSLPALYPSLKEDSYSYAVFFCWIGFPFFFIFLVASIWLVVGVSLNRFIMITFPMKVKVIYTRKRTYYSILGFFIFSLLSNIPHFFNYKPENTTGGKWKVGITEYGASEGSKNYEFWVHCIFIVLAPWITIAILNSIIVYKLYKQSKIINQKLMESTNCERKSKQENREHQMTRTLFVVTFAFLILLAWQCIIQCFWMTGYGKSEQHSYAWVMIDKNFAFAKMGVILNSAANCLLYCFTGSMFKKELIKIFCNKFNVKQNSSSYEKTSTKSSLLQNETRSL